MLRHRVIPCLLLSGERLVKTHCFRNPSYVGDPLNAVRILNEKEVDELLLLDIDASRSGRGPDFEMVREIASECFMPLAYGGGVNSVECARKLFACGVEKVVIQSAALDDIRIIEQIASRFGSQSVVVSVDVVRAMFGTTKLYESRSRRHHPKPWKEFLRNAVQQGAGEIFLHAVHREGTRSGMDLELIREAASVCRIPLIACGGASQPSDFHEAVLAGADAVAAGAMFVYHGPRRAVLITYPAYAELETLLNG